MFVQTNELIVVQHYFKPQTIKLFLHSPFPFSVPTLFVKAFKHYQLTWCKYAVESYTNKSYTNESQNCSDIFDLTLSIIARKCETQNFWIPFSSLHLSLRFTPQNLIKILFDQINLLRQIKLSLPKDCMHPIVPFCQTLVNEANFAQGIFQILFSNFLTLP